MLRKSIISLYTRNSIDGPSDYYRVIQYLDKIYCKQRVHDALPRKLFRLNLDVNEGIIKKIVQAFLFIIICLRRTTSILHDFLSPPDLIIIQREAFPRKIPFIGYFLLKTLLMKNRVIWDFDDDIFNGELSAAEEELLIKYSNCIITISDYLKSLLPIEAQNRTIALPTTDKIIEDNQLAEIIERRTVTLESEIRIVWLGTAANLINLDIVVKEFEELALILKNLYHKKLVFTVVCNKQYGYFAQNYELRNIKWSKEVAENELLISHIGIMPLADTKFSKGKGGFKLIQYMCTGLPIIGSDVGFNKEIIENGVNGYLVDDRDDSQTWGKAIIAIISSKSMWKCFSLNAYAVYKRKFSFDKNLFFF